MKKFLLGLLLFLLPLITYGQVQNNYWKLTAGTIQPNLSTWTETLPYLPSKGCLGTDVNGLIQTGTCAGSGSSPFPFTPTTNYGVAVNSTSTPIWFTNGLMASTSSYIANTTFLTNGNVGIGTTTPQYLFTALGTNAIAFNGTQLSLFQPSKGISGAGALLFSVGGTGDNSLTFAGWNSNVGGITYGTGAALHNFRIGPTSGSGNMQLSIGPEAVNGTGSGETFVAIGATSTPFAKLSIAGKANGTTPLFAISSSTSAFATTTALVIDQNGQVTITDLQSSATTNTCATSSGLLTITGCNNGTDTFAWPFTPATNYAVNTSATTTPVWFQVPTSGSISLMASSTAAFDQLTVSSTTATSTFATGGLTIGTNQFVVQQTSGRVGIATANPTQALSITGAGGITGAWGVGAVADSSIGQLRVFANLSAAAISGVQTGAGPSAVFTGGNVGVGTTSPYALLSVATPNGSTGGTNTLFAIASSTATATTTLFSITSRGHHIASSTNPVLTSCGTNPTMRGDDTHGEVTLGTTATGCVITFQIPYTVAPICVVDWEATPLASQSDVVSATAITLTQTSTSNNKVSYICQGLTGL